MYKANKCHLQSLLISTVNDSGVTAPASGKFLGGGLLSGVLLSHCGRALAVLFADCPSRPNIPVNVLVGLETLKAGFGWSDEELYEAFLYNLQLRYALGYWICKKAISSCVRSTTSGSV